jgi:hypothetical protein
MILWKYDLTEKTQKPIPKKVPELFRLEHQFSDYNAAKTISISKLLYKSPAAFFTNSSGRLTPKDRNVRKF